MRSTTHGRTFRDAAQGEFAGRMHTDLTDALDALVAQGVTDPVRRWRSWAPATAAPAWSA